jgi:hypothetical protein
MFKPNFTAVSFLPGKKQKHSSIQVMEIVVETLKNVDWKVQQNCEGFWKSSMQNFICEVTHERNYKYLHEKVKNKKNTYHEIKESCEVLKVWNTIPETHVFLKMTGVAILCVFRLFIHVSYYFPLWTL